MLEKDDCLKTNKYSNSNPPYLDKKWKFEGHTDVLELFRSKGWIPPTEKRK